LICIQHWSTLITTICLVFSLYEINDFARTYFTASNLSLQTQVSHRLAVSDLSSSVQKQSPRLLKSQAYIAQHAKQEYKVSKQQFKFKFSMKFYCFLYIKTKKPLQDYTKFATIPKYIMHNKETS